MLSLCIPSLLDLCGIRFAYRMWTRHDVTERLPVEELFQKLIETVRADVENSPLPDRVKMRLWKHLEPVGKHLLSVLNVLLTKAQHESSQKWLTGDMFFDCLVLHADGLINQRETARKLLHNCMLNDVFAFRLACIYFLETDVLKLWPLVKLYILNGILHEAEKPPEDDTVRSHKNLFRIQICFDFPMTFQKSSVSSSLSFIAVEPHEVLSWVCYCLSKEENIGIDGLLEFMGISEGWQGVSQLEYDLVYNVACYEYFCNENVKYNHVEMMRKLFYLKEEDHRQICFIFHFNRLNFQERADLFQFHPKAVISQFLQWPLSLTFIENAQEVWKLIPDECKQWIFKHIVNILLSKKWKPSVQPYFFNESIRNIGPRVLDEVPPIHCVEHLKRIWITLWEISSVSFKLPVLNDILDFSPLKIFKGSIWERKVRNIFLNNGEVVFDLCTTSNLKESLTNLVGTHMPEDSLMFNKYIYLMRGIDVFTLKKRETVYFESVQSAIRSRSFIVKREFVSYIKDYLFSLNNMDKMFYNNKLIHFEANFLKKS